MKIILFFFLLYQIEARVSQKASFPKTTPIPVNNDAIVVQPKMSDVRLQLSSNSDILKRWRNAEATTREFMREMLNKLNKVSFDIFIEFNISTTCGTALMDYIRGLNDMKTWAFAMLDSSGKFPQGIIRGQLSTLGDYDTCIDTEAPSFKGKYCLLAGKPPLPERHLFQSVDIEIPPFKGIADSGYIFGKLANIASSLYLSHGQVSYCMPSVCTEGEIEFVLKKVVKYVSFGFDMSVASCEVKEDMPFSSGEISIIMLLCFMLFLVITGTIIDVFYRWKSNMHGKGEKGAFISFVQCFSVSSNTSRLLKYEYNSEAISIFHGIRVITMLWVILCHTYFIKNAKIYDRLNQNKKMTKELKFQLIITGFLSVDSFFFISSVLVSYICMRLKTRLRIMPIFIKRYYRLTPGLMFVIAICSLAGHFGSGPFWREMIIDGLAKNCKNNGWLAMLYISNYSFSEKMCMTWTWYLSADVQLFVIGLYCVGLLRKSPRKGFISVGFFLLLGIFSTALSHIYYKIPPTFLMPFIHKDDWYYYASNGYTPTHIHLSVYCVGLCVGYILATKEVRIPKHINVMGWLTSTTLMFCLIFGTWNWNKGNIPGLFVATIFGATHRLIWALCLGFITISCSTGHGGIITRFLSWKAFVPVGRLTYMCYLIHSVIINIYFGSTRSTISYDHRTMMFAFCGVVIFTFISSFILTMMFESPFSALDNLFTKRPQLEKTAQLANGIGRTSKQSI